MTTLRVLDLFSGIGGFSLGLERTGAFETVAFCEPDPYASEVLKKWWPSVPNIRGGVVALNSLLKMARISSRRDFPARISHSLAQAPDLPAPVRDSFGHSCEPFAWYDQQSRSWRTWQRCLVEGWATFSGTWPRSGMTRSGIAYRRAPLVPLTKGIGSGSLPPTPTASQYGSNRSVSDGASRWPTPTAVDGRRGTGTWRPHDTGLALPQAVAMAERGLWPKPCASDARGSSGKNRQGRQVQLVDAVRFDTPTLAKNSRPLSEQIGGSLNPTWVEWLMGFPLGWTDCAASATPSSRRSRNSSASPSSKRQG